MEDFVVYVLYSEKFDQYYTGFTSGLIERFYSLNKFSKKGYTTKFRPWIVVYVEFFNNKKDAMNREKFLKSGVGRQFLKLNLKK